MRNLYIAGNWKMNMVPSEAAKYAASLAAAAKDAKVKVMIAPTFVCLPV